MGLGVIGNKFRQRLLGWPGGKVSMNLHSVVLYSSSRGGHHGVRDARYGGLGVVQCWDTILYSRVYGYVWSPSNFCPILRPVSNGDRKS